MWRLYPESRLPLIAIARPVLPEIDAKPSTSDAAKTVYSPTYTVAIMEDIWNVFTTDKVLVFKKYTNKR